MQKTQKMSSVSKICFAAVMAALYVGLDYAATGLSTLTGGTIKISLNALPVIITAILLGPIWGALTGGVGAFIGQLLTYGITVTTPLWICPAIIRGLAVGLLFIFFKRSLNRIPLIINIVVSSLLVTAANTAVMYIDSKIYGYYSYTYVFGGIVPRVLIGIASAAIFAVIIPNLIQSIVRIIKVR